MWANGDLKRSNSIQDGMEVWVEEFEEERGKEGEVEKKEAEMEDLV